MSVVKQYSCDNPECINKSTNEHGWLVLHQQGVPDIMAPKLVTDLYFCSLECHWLSLAVEIFPGLAKTAASVTPRGMFTSKKVPGLYV